MTEYGVIKELSIEYPGEYHKQREAKDIAIRAIKENLEYRKLGTLEELLEAKEKQEPKELRQDGCFDKDGNFHTWNGVNGRPYLLCPTCGINLCYEMPGDKKPKYCENCGQKLR